MDTKTDGASHAQWQSARVGAQPATVYYDGACPLCRREIAFFRRRALPGAVRFEDVSAWAPDTEKDGLDRGRAMRRFHVSLPDGNMVSGARGFAALWRVTPGLRLIGRVAERAPLVHVLEWGYVRFLGVRPWLQRLAGSLDADTCDTVCPGVVAKDALPSWLLAELRSDHAGETGAVQIYRGIQMVSRDTAVRDFASRHMTTEARHLQLMEQLVPPGRRSRLLPLWRIAGWLTGALPALFGPRAVYITVDAVESFVDAHYAAQIAALDADGPHAALRQRLLECRAEELSHRDEARESTGAPAGLIGRIWRWVVDTGSKAGVAIARRI